MRSTRAVAHRVACTEQHVKGPRTYFSAPHRREARRVCFAYIYLARAVVYIWLSRYLFMSPRDKVHCGVKESIMSSCGFAFRDARKTRKKDIASLHIGNSNCSASGESQRL